MTVMQPKINVEYTENATIVTFRDEKILQEQDIKSIQTTIFSVVEQGEKINLVLNFANVKFLSSAVLGLLIRISKKVYEQNGKLRLCDIDPKIYEIFKITRLTEVFQVHKSLDNAIQSLSDEDITP